MPIVSLQNGMSLPFDLEQHRDSDLKVVVGSSSVGVDGAIFRLSNVLARHAEIFQIRDDVNNGDRTWWVRPISQDADVFVNGNRVTGRTQLLPGYKLAFVSPDADAYEDSVRFSITEDGKLCEAPDEKCGVSICCKGLSAKGVDESGKEKVLLDDVSFKVKKGEFVGIIGPSGCGKSSLLERLAGIGDWKEGEIWINGQNLREVGDNLSRQRVFVVQEAASALHEDLTIWQELDAVHRTHAIGRDVDHAADEYAIKKFNLQGKEFSSRVIRKYSGGEKRRAALARALALKPKLLLLDEPTAGLDPDRECEVMRWLKDVSGGEGGCTVLCVTHVLANSELFDHVLIFANGGRLICSASPRKALEKFKKVCENRGDDPSQIRKLEDIYPMLSHDVEKLMEQMQDGCTVAEPSPENLPEAAARASFGRSVRGHLKRLLQKLKCMPKWWNNVIFLPALLAFLIRFVCTDYVKMGRNVNSEAYVLPFCTCLAVFWLGLVTSVRDLVDERYPRRSLERREGVALAPYLTAKYVWRIALAGCQALVFSFSFILAVLVPYGTDAGGQLLSLATILPLVFSAWMGVLIGLAVSAISTSTTSAVGCVPYVAIAQLLFSKVVLERDDYIWIVVALKKCMPCDQTIECLKSLWFDGKFLSGRGVYDWILPTLIAVELVVFGVLCQDWREKTWRGR